MPRQGGISTEAGIVPAIVIGVVGMLLLIVQVYLSPAGPDVGRHTEQNPHEKTSRQHCDAKLRALGRNVPSDQRNQDGDGKQHSDDDLCARER